MSITIRREIEVKRKGLPVVIDVTYGTDLIQMEFKVTDCIIPAESAAVAYNQGRTAEVHKQICIIDENVISFTPEKGFFEEGRNELQLRVVHNNRSLFTFKCRVECQGSFADSDAEEVKRNSSLVEQLMTEQAVTKARLEEVLKLPEDGSDVEKALNDIKVGADGKVYSSPGEAVRQQIGQVSQQIVELESDILEQMYFNKNNFDGKYVKHAYYSSTDGTLLLNKPNYVCTKNMLDVSAGDTLVFDDCINAINIYLYNYNGNTLLGTNTLESPLNGVVHSVGENVNGIHVVWMFNSQEEAENPNYAIITKNPIDTSKEQIHALNNSIFDKYIDSKKYVLGTAFVDNGNIYQENSDNTIRIIREKPINLNKGDLIKIGKNQKVRLIKVTVAPNKGTQITNYTTDDILINEYGKYIIVIGTVDFTPITDIEEFSQRLTIINDKSKINTLFVNPLTKRVEKLENTNTRIDNSAKSVFAIMSFNVGSWYDGSGNFIPNSDYEKYVNLYKNIFDRYNPDIVCLQEFKSKLTNDKSVLDEIVKERYHFYPYAKENSTYDGKAILTNRTLIEPMNVAFVNTDGDLVRNYEKAYIYMNGKKVCVISLHFATNLSVCEKECVELINAISNEDYVIICGDTNINALDKSSSEYAKTLKLFEEAGYEVVNDSKVTYPSNSVAIDNIIVTPNISIKSVVVDEQKNGIVDTLDHYPLIAYLEVF